MEITYIVDIVIFYYSSREGQEIMVNFKEFNSVTSLYFSIAEKLSQKPHLWTKVEGKYKSINWNETKEDIIHLSSNLINNGILKGDRVFICSENRPEFFIADLSIMAAGGISVPAYTTNTSKDHEYILKHSGARGAIVSNIEIAKKVIPAVIASPKCEFLIIVDDEGKEFSEPVTIYNWKKFLSEGKENIQNIIEQCNLQKRGDTACIIYTSGTGGNPKGVMLSHGAMLHNCHGADKLLKNLIIDLKKINFLSWLPLSHSYEHTLQFLMTGWGAETYYSEGADKLLVNMGETKPHIMCAVPRFYDTLYLRISTGLKNQSKIRRKLFAETIRLGKKKYFKDKMSKIESIIDSILTKIVRKKVKARFGGNIRVLVSGGAALNFEVGLYLSALGLPLLQGYGQTETAPVISSNPISKIKLDTVGIPFDGVEVKIADDGEIVVRGDNVMNGYWNDPESTSKTLVNGWIHTGDIGEIDDEGYIKITDRKKDIIVNAGGENISPSRIQEKIEINSEIVQSMVYGDDKNYLIAIIVPDDEFLKNWAKEKDKEANLSKLASDKEFNTEILNIIEKVNNNLSTIEKIRKIIIAKEPFTVENEMMTPTLKVRRFQVVNLYKDEINSLYN